MNLVLFLQGAHLHRSLACEKADEVFEKAMCAFEMDLGYIPCLNLYSKLSIILSLGEDIVSRLSMPSEVVPNAM